MSWLDSLLVLCTGDMAVQYLLEYSYIKKLLCTINIPFTMFSLFATCPMPQPPLVLFHHHNTHYKSSTQASPPTPSSHYEHPIVKQRVQPSLVVSQTLRPAQPIATTARCHHQVLPHLPLAPPPSPMPPPLPLRSKSGKNSYVGALFHEGFDVINIFFPCLTFAIV